MIQNILVRKELGNFPALLVDIMTCLYSWGLIITYEIIMNSLIGRVIYVFFKNKDTYPTFDNYENEEWDTIKIKIIVLGSINALLIILCLVKDIGRMKFFSLFGIIALFYTIIVLVIESPFYWKHYLNNVYQKNDKSTHANWIDISKAFNSNLDFFTGFATIVFSFSNHQGALPVYRSLEPNNDQPVMNNNVLLEKNIFLGEQYWEFSIDELTENNIILYLNTDKIYLLNPFNGDLEIILECEKINKVLYLSNGIIGFVQYNEKFNLFNIFHKQIECTFANPFYGKISTFEKMTNGDIAICQARQEFYYSILVLS